MVGDGVLQAAEAAEEEEVAEGKPGGVSRVAKEEWEWRPTAVGGGGITTARACTGSGSTRGAPAGGGAAV